MKNKLVVVLMVVPMTSPDHVVDHKWSVGVLRLSSYLWVSIFVIFQEHFGGGADGGAGDHF